MAKDKYGGRLASLFGVMSDQTNPQDYANAMGKMLLDTYMQVTGQDKTNKAELKRLFEEFVDPTGTFKRDANLRAELIALESVFKQKMTSGSRLLHDQRFNLEDLQRPIPLGSQVQDD